MVMVEIGSAIRIMSVFEIGVLVEIWAAIAIVVTNGAGGIDMNWFETNYPDTCQCSAYLFTHEAGAGRCKAGTPAGPHGQNVAVGYYARIACPSK